MKEKQPEAQVVVVGTGNALCRACGEVVLKGARAWYKPGLGLQHLECPAGQVPKIPDPPKIPDLPKVPDLPSTDGK